MRAKRTAKQKLIMAALAAAVVLSSPSSPAACECGMESCTEVPALSNVTTQNPAATDTQILDPPFRIPLQKVRSSRDVAKAANQSVIREVPYRNDYEAAIGDEGVVYAICDGCPSITEPERIRQRPKVTLSAGRSIVSSPQETNRNKVKRPRLPAREGLLWTIRFDLDSSRLSDEERKKLETIARRSLKGVEPARIRIKGYTCALGGKEHNDRLALARAKAAAAALIQIGVRAGEVTGEGKCCFVDKEGLSPANRRVEVIRLPPEKETDNKGG